jgi:SAM-dependent methyltransferase
VYLRRWRSFGGGSALLDAVLREKFGFPDSRRASKARFHALCARVLPERYFAEHPRRRFLFHQTQAIWFDLFEDLFCRHRGVLPADFDVLDFIAERARKARSEVAAVAELVPAEVGLPPYAYAQPVSARVLQESAVPVSSPPQVTDADDRPTAVRESRELDPATQGVVARLCDIVRAVGGSELETNGTELWFTLPGEPRVQVRLGADPESPCYDRSANFAISYGGGRSDEPPSSAFVGAIDSMKAIDDTTMGDVPAKFSLAAAHVVERLLDGAGAQSDASPAGTPTEVPSKQPSSDYSGARWECHGTRELNVMFLDLCARLIGGGQPLTSLHWGYWSDPGAERALMEAGDHDPFEAFSLNLLAHVPESAIHILDVGCGLGANAKILASRQKVVTALSPVPHHCAAIEAARLPGVDVHCARFEELRPDRAYDLLLFSESVNHFDLRDAFFAYCATFLRPGGFLLLADDLTAERAEQIAAQRVFRLVREVDISANVAPTGQWWARHMRAFVAFRAALLELLEMRERGLAARVQEVFEGLESSDLRALFSGETAAPVSKGRYLIYLLQL